MKISILILCLSLAICCNSLAELQIAAEFKAWQMNVLETAGCAEVIVTNQPCRYSLLYSTPARIHLQKATPRPATPEEVALDLKLIEATTEGRQARHHFKLETFNIESVHVQSWTNALAKFLQWAKIATEHPKVGDFRKPILEYRSSAWQTNTFIFSVRDSKPFLDIERSRLTPTDAECLWWCLKQLPRLEADANKELSSLRQIEKQQKKKAKELDSLLK